MSTTDARLRAEFNDALDAVRQLLAKSCGEAVARGTTVPPARAFAGRILTDAAEMTEHLNNASHQIGRRDAWAAIDTERLERAVAELDAASEVSHRQGVELDTLLATLLTDGALSAWDLELVTWFARTIEGFAELADELPVLWGIAARALAQRRTEDETSPLEAA